VAAATGAAFAAAVALLAAAPTAATFGFLGLVLVAAGASRASERALTYGTGVQTLGVAFAGFAGGGVEATLAAAVAVVIAWDLGDHALSLGADVGRNGRSRRNLLVHAAGTLVVGALTAGIAYGTYLAATGGQPIAALVFLLLGAVVVASAFR